MVTNVIWFFRNFNLSFYLLIILTIHFTLSKTSNIEDLSKIYSNYKSFKKLELLVKNNT